MILASQKAAQTTPLKVTDKATSTETLYAKKRRFPRYDVEDMDMHAQMLFSEEVVLNDVSVRGARIHTMKDLLIGGKYLINIPDGKMSRYIPCRAVWKSDNRSNDYPLQGYAVGLQFQDIASDELVRLKDFMRTSGIPDEKKANANYEPTPLRFMISNKKATLKLPKILNVRKISLGGMLIESDTAPGLEGRYPVKLPLPRESAPITCQARIASVIARADSRSPRFDIGIEFLSMEDTDRARLGNFIQSRETKA